MHIARVGLTPLKGGRHVTHDEVELGLPGPVGDRVFCLVDPARRRVLRTVENPTLVQTVARWDRGHLHVALPGVTVTGEPHPTGEFLDVDYWGRRAEVEVVAGPWAAAYSRHLGYDVLLARGARAGEVVYGGSVSLVTTSALHELADRLRAPVDSTRFRATFLVDDGPGLSRCAGRHLRLGGATVRVRGAVPRCAVVDLDPRTGARDLPVLRTLAGYRRDLNDADSVGGVAFGVDAVVTRPGWVRIGDPVSVGRDHDGSAGEPGEDVTGRRGAGVAENAGRG